jgi:gamma-glutamyltranspeptidase
MHQLIQVVVHVFEQQKPPQRAVDAPKYHRPKYAAPNAYTHHMQQKKEQQEQAYMNAYYPQICTAA